MREFFMILRDTEETRREVAVVCSGLEEVRNYIRENESATEHYYIGCQFSAPQYMSVVINAVARKDEDD